MMFSTKLGKLSRIALMIPAALVFTVPSAADAQVSRVIRFYNACHVPIEFTIRNNPYGNGWDSHGWYRLRPYRSSTFSARGRTLTQSTRHSLYFYARATDGSGKVWSGSNRQRFRGAYYPYKKLVTTVRSDGSLNARITCSRGY